MEGQRAVAALLLLVLAAGVGAYDPATASSPKPDEEARRRGANGWKAREAQARLAHERRIAALTAGERKQLDEARRRNERAVRLYRSERYEESLVEAEAALRTWRELLGPRDLETVAGIRNRAQVLLSLDRHEEAVATLREVRTAYVSVLGPGHPKSRGSLGRLSSAIEERAGRLESEEAFPEAIAARKETVELRVALHGEDDWRLTDARLALSYAEMLGRLEEDERRSLADADRICAEARAKYLAGAYAQAVSLAHRALRLQKDVLGADHPDAALSMSYLAAVHQAMGEYEKAESSYGNVSAFSTLWRIAS